MVYQDILNLLATEEVAHYIPEGISHSKAMFLKENGKLIHRFFTYGLNFPGTTGEAPFAILDLDAASGALLHYTKCDKAHEIDAAAPADRETAWKGIETYETLYPEVVVLFEKGDLTQDEHRTVQTFRDAIDQFVSPGLKEIYTQVAPEMFEFLAKA